MDFELIQFPRFQRASGSSNIWNITLSRSNFVKSAGCYAVGEVFNGNIGYVAGYKAPQGPLPGILSYPLFFAMRDVWAYQHSMYELQNINQAYQSQLGDLGLMGKWGLMSFLMDRNFLG
jgi:hypothetical protein